MKYKVEWLEVKNPEWYMCTLTSESGETKNDVSINKTNKKGEAFPNFDQIKAGSEIEGEFWPSASGKCYLFPPKPKYNPVAPYRASGGVSKLMDKKAENIKEAQERKSESIAYFNSVNSAIALLTDNHTNPQMSEEQSRRFIIEWRDWFLSEYDAWNSDQHKHNPF